MNYKIEAIQILLNKDCILERYYPLISYKELLISNLKRIGCNTKNECTNLNNESLLELGLPNIEMVNLFKRFLIMYDVNNNKLKEIEKFNLSEEEKNAFYELYLLPGVKYVRAKLYYDSGYDNLSKIANASTKEIIELTSKTILNNGLDLKAPLPKEVRTHIAVAEAITEYGAN